MKILAIGDPHGKLPRNLDRIIKKNKIDVIVCAGDVPPVPAAFRKGKIDTFPKSFLEKGNKLFENIVKKLCSYKKPVLILRGNMYLTGSRDKLTKDIFSKYDNLHYKKIGKIKINKKNFVFFDMSFEPFMYRKEDPFLKRQFKFNNPRKKKLNDLLKRLDRAIIISHAPPFGVLDKVMGGENRGSKILLRAIKKHQPSLVLCGHIHEAQGIARIGKTVVYNLGCCGDYEVIEVGK